MVPGNVMKITFSVLAIMFLVLLLAVSHLLNPFQMD